MSLMLAGNEFQSLGRAIRMSMRRCDGMVLLVLFHGESVCSDCGGKKACVVAERSKHQRIQLETGTASSIVLCVVVVICVRSELCQNGKQMNINKKKRRREDMKINLKLEDKKMKWRHDVTYVTSKGAVAEDKSFAPVTSCCQKKCLSTFTADEQEDLFEIFYRANKITQDATVAEHVSTDSRYMIDTENLRQQPFVEREESEKTAHIRRESSTLSSNKMEQRPTDTLSG
ncbi:hypothetical protein ANN_04363 [Periplaneta americana]|uniref:Uncharacterized protein n=1 Tax=Periplaneta americana TaxID=6978 RepID=A0ABQ8T9W3_PERAM|nr:hypothetical protein ANN_04363 [Periplaneta americana]